MNTRVSAFALAAALVGCADGPPSGPVEGTYVDRYLDEDTEAELAAVERDLSGYTIFAVTGEAADGPRYAGSGTEGGLFTVPDVPDGPLWVALQPPELATSYRWLDGRELALGARAVGRPDVVRATTGTELRIQATGASPWALGDEIQAAGPHNRTMVFQAQFWSPTDPAFGDTSLDFTLPMRGYTGASALFDAAAGDDLWVAQLVSNDDAGRDGVAYRAVERFFLAPPFTTPDGETTTVTGAFEPAPARTLDVQIDRDAFDDAARVEGGTPSVFTTLYVTAYPVDPDAFAGFGWPDLVVASWPPMVDPGLLEATFAYGDPYPVAWARQVSVQVPYDLGENGGGVIEIDAPLDEVLSSATPLAPTVTPVRAPTVDGRPLTAPQTGVGLEPRIGWVAPEGAERVSVHIGVYDATIDWYPPRVSFYDVPGSSVKVPAGVLAPGDSVRATIWVSRGHTAASFDSEPFTP